MVQQAEGGVMKIFGRRDRKIVITAPMFASLVVGHQVEGDGVQLIFEDMGFDVMVGMVREAARRSGYQEPFPGTL